MSGAQLEKPAHMVLHYTDRDITNWPSNLKSAEQISHSIKHAISENRLIELANSGYIPHFRIDGGPPLFIVQEVKDWMSKNLLRHCGGREIEFNVVLFSQPSKPNIARMPSELRSIANLIDLSDCRIGPGVYFLCRNNKVIYVGQSISPLSRIAQHERDKEFEYVFFLPVPRSNLDEVEMAFIRTLQPELNGAGITKRPISNDIAQEDHRTLEVYNNFDQSLEAG